MNAITGREQEARLKSYYREVQRTHPLTREKERELAQLVRDGDVEARNTLVTANLRFALDVAKRYVGRGVPLEELISAANIGLIEAAKRFDGKSGVRFITYGVHWIRREILLVLANKTNLVHVPKHVQELQSKVHRAISAMQQDLERLPSVSEIADQLDEKEQTVLQAVSNEQTIYSLEEPDQAYLEKRKSWLDVLEDPTKADELDVSENLEQEDLANQMMSGLKQREAEVVRRYYGFDGEGGYNLAEIGRDLNLSRERVRQIKATALKRLRKRFHN